MHEITVREDGTISLIDAAMLCGVELGAIRQRLRRGLLREVRRENGRILVNLLDVARLDSAMRKYGQRAYPEVSWRLEGEPDVDIFSVFRTCQEIARQSAPATREPVIYYVRFGERVKIGTTMCLTGRLQDVPHDEVLATEPGGAELERKRHAQFAEHWITGEWFRLAPEIMQHVALLAERCPLRVA